MGVEEATASGTSDLSDPGNCVRSGEFGTVRGRAIQVASHSAVFHLFLTRGCTELEQGEPEVVEHGP